MKKIAVTTLLVLALAVFTSGCASVTQPAAPVVPVATNIAVPATPTIIGTWQGTMQGYEEGIGFTDYKGEMISMVVTEQKGRIFSGYISFGANSTKQLPMAGVLGRDGRTFAMVENVNGYTTGEIIGGNTMELTHIDDAEPYSAALDTLKKV